MIKILDLVLELVDMYLTKDLGIRNKRWLGELISELYEEYARVEAEEGFKNAD